MSFLRPEDSVYEHKVLGGCCNSVGMMGSHVGHYGAGISDVLDRIINPSTANTFSKLILSMPNVVDTIKNVVGSDPQELNKALEETLSSNPSSIEDVIKTLNVKHSKKGAGSKLLNNQSKMILDKIMRNQGYSGAGISTM